MELPPLAEILNGSLVVELPLVARFRGIHTREIVLVEGPQGWAEFSPFLEYPDAEAAQWFKAAVEFAWAELPNPARETIQVNATVPAVTAAEVPGVLARFAGCKTAKVKVAEAGQSLQDDIERVAAVREVMGNTAKIRVDANGAWSVEEARTALSALAQYQLEYVEQPCATIAELAQLRHWTQANGLKIAADESIRKESDPLAVAHAEAADLIVVKTQPLGGISQATEIISASGLPAVVSSAIESSVGISMGLALAARIPELEYACGLGTVNLLQNDICQPALSPVNGEIQVSRTAPDAQAAASRKVSAERHQWWINRATRCYEILASGFERA